VEGKATIVLTWFEGWSTSSSTSSTIIFIYKIEVCVEMGGMRRRGRRRRLLTVTFTFQPFTSAERADRDRIG